MKKWIFLIPAVFLLLFNLLSVSADYISIPSDEFRSTHWSECTYHDKYYTNPEKIDIYTSPDHNTPYHQAPAGNLFLITYLYTDENGVLWGNQGTEVWMKMDGLTVLYSHDEFIADHSEDIIEVDERVIYDTEGYIAFYNYPNSDWVTNVIYAFQSAEFSGINPTLIYTDEQGTLWGYESHFFGEAGWFKLDNPVIEKRIPETRMVVYTPNQDSMKYDILFLVIIACVLTGGLYVLLHKKK